MAEIWAVRQFNPIKVIDPTKSGRGGKLVSRLYPTSKKLPQKFNLKRLKNGRIMT